ncbi:uncharacterized protein PFL1_03256 [Pseudozyma flocculosa PF-1]|uniref:BZIP domain-containing protein n=2 Tax=Pseudozyma flocculosa TaxID=84751 RepID=A0A5C3F9B1_9BASI|nr:uncharacterized protein PFL1_03256 [Pseudozyma flocculosa PF-1]EPQ28966.1 hypothetical protein PFL1_03256 [Pseudozyma flocculosa PF-1]SPO39959.1 uncharacterized protein PSFLO_05441 [Pseudozyma flocculosa]
MPPAHRGPTGAPIDRWTTASATAIASGFNAAMALGPQPKIATSNSNAAGPYATASFADTISDEDDDDDEDNPGDDQGVSPPNGATSTAKQKAKGKAAATATTSRTKDAAALAHRKEQNRAAQREFRQRKQQYIRALEARVELLSSDHDTQVDRLRFALRQLLAENNTLRTIVASLASFIGSGDIGGCMAQAGLTRAELEDAMNNRSEKTMTEAWQNWPGAKECEALRQIRLESNIPLDGLPESKLPYGCSTSSRQGQASQATQPPNPRADQEDIQTQAEPAATTSAKAKTPADASKKRKRSASGQQRPALVTHRKSVAQATDTSAPLDGHGTAAASQPQLDPGTDEWQRSSQRSQTTAASLSGLGASVAAPPGSALDPSAAAAAAAAAITAALPPAQVQAQAQALAPASIASTLTIVPASTAPADGPFASPELWQQQQQLSHLYMLQQQSPSNSLDATFLQTLFGDLGGQTGTGSGTADHIAATPGAASLDPASPFSLLASMQMMAGGVGSSSSSSNGGTSDDYGAALMSFSPAAITPTRAAASGSAGGEPLPAAGATLLPLTRSSSISAGTAGPAPAQQARRSSGGTPTSFHQQLHRTSTSSGPNPMRKRYTRVVAAVNRMLRKRGFHEFVDLPPDCELTHEDLRHVEEQERSRPYLILAHHGFEGDLQDELETRGPDGRAQHKLLNRRHIERIEDSFIQLHYHFQNFRMNPKYRLPPLLRPTPIQQAQPHAPDIDSVPWSSIRDALILYPQLDFDEVIFEMIRGAEIHDGDILMEEQWEIHRPFLVRFPIMAEDKVLDVSNAWRKRRGQEPLTREQLWRDHAMLREAERRKWKELGEPFPLPDRDFVPRPRPDPTSTGGPSAIATTSSES